MSAETVIISPRKRKQLAAFLATLPEAAALKLFAALELDRAAGGEALPHDELLGDLRAWLIERGVAPPPRRPDAMRIFFKPFEDLFIGDHDGEKRTARIARTSLAPIWGLMMTEKATGAAEVAAGALDDALRVGGKTKKLERAMFLAAEAGLARLFDEVQADPAARAALVDALGGQAVFDDLEEIRRLLTGIEYFKTLQAMAPDASPSLNEEQLYDLRTLFSSAHKQSPAIATYILLALKGRLERPWRALAAYYNLVRGGDDERLEGAEEAVAALPESLFGDLEALARGLERDGAGLLDAHAAMVRTNYFADFADGLAKEAEKAGDDVFLNRVEACRGVAAVAFERFAEQALAVLRQTTPARSGGGSSRLAARRPDYAAALSPAAVDDATAAAVLIESAPATARRLNADPGYTSSIAQDASDGLETFAADLVVEIRAAEGDARKAARRMFDQILKIAAPLLDRDVVDQLRDRATAAAVAV